MTRRPRTNVEKVLERDTKLTALDERADALQSGASQFEKQASKLKQRFWLANTKWLVLGLLLLAAGLGLAYYHYHDAAAATGQTAAGQNTTEQFTSAPEVVLDTKDTKVEIPSPEHQTPS